MKYLMLLASGFACSSVLCMDENLLGSNDSFAYKMVQYIKENGLSEVNTNVNLDGELYYAEARKIEGTKVPFIRDDDNPYYVIFQLLDNQFIRINLFEEAQRQNPRLNWKKYEELSVCDGNVKFNITVNGVKIDQACKSIITNNNAGSFLRIPENVTELVDINYIDYKYLYAGTFRDISVDTIVFPKSLKIIPRYTCTLCGVKNVVIQDGTIEIKRDAFFDCPYLQKICIPETVREIDSKFLSECTSVTEMEFSCVPKYKHIIVNLYDRYLAFFDVLPHLNVLKLPSSRKISVRKRKNSALVFILAEKRRIVRLAYMPIIPRNNEDGKACYIELGNRRIDITDDLFANCCVVEL